MFAFSIVIYYREVQNRGDDTKGTQYQLVEQNLIVTIAAVGYHTHLR